MHERDVANLLSGLLFEERLARIAEGFCPYCEVALGERVSNDKGTIQSRCSCCGGLFKTLCSEKDGPGWFSNHGHDCPHIRAWVSDEHPIRPRFEYRHKVILNRAGRLGFFLR
jgi:hypothetical protein